MHLQLEICAQRQINIYIYASHIVQGDFGMVARDSSLQYILNDDPERFRLQGERPVSVFTWGERTEAQVSGTLSKV